MFITKTEKKWMTASIQALQQQVKDIREVMEEQNERHNRLKEYAIRKKHRVEELEKAIEVAATDSKDIFTVFDSVFPMDEAPWGYKKDGTPKKRPGRPLKSQKGNQP
jgi:predicted nuclease with TOPRIM domain